MFLELTQGYQAIVDDDDPKEPWKYKWYADKVKNTVYASRNFIRPDGKRRVLRLHRFLLGVTDPKVEVDHKDGNGLNCKRSNIREATHAQNLKNQTINSKNSSGVKGVYWHQRRNKWIARIESDKKVHYLGEHENLEDAKKARLAAEIIYHKDFASQRTRYEFKSSSQHGSHK